MHVSTPSGPPSPCWGTSPYPGLDRPASGLIRATPGAFTPRPSLSVRTCRFPYGFGVPPLNLAARMNSLPRVSRRTVQPRSSPLVLAPREAFLRGDSLLKGHTQLSPPGFRLFSPPSRGAFQLSLTVLVRYRSRNVFRVGSRCLPASRRISDRRYSGTPQEPSGLRLRGYHPLRRRVPADFGFTREAPMQGPATPHPLSVSTQGSVCPVPFSVAPTHGIAFAFFSCGY